MKKAAKYVLLIIAIVIVSFYALWIGQTVHKRKQLDKQDQLNMQLKLRNEWVRDSIEIERKKRELDIKYMEISGKKSDER